MNDGLLMAAVERIGSIGKRRHLAGSLSLIDPFHPNGLLSEAIKREQ